MTSRFRIDKSKNIQKQARRKADLELSNQNISKNYKESMWKYSVFRQMKRQVRERVGQKKIMNRWAKHHKKNEWRDDKNTLPKLLRGPIRQAGGVDSSLNGLPSCRVMWIWLKGNQGLSTITSLVVKNGRGCPSHFTSSLRAQSMAV